MMARTKRPTYAIGESPNQSRQRDISGDYAAATTVPIQHAARPTASERRRRVNAQDPQGKRKEKGKAKLREEPNEDDDEDEIPIDEEVDRGQESGEADDEDDGSPNDKSILKDYKTHVARDIWLGKDREPLKCRHQYSRCEQWILDREPELVKSMVMKSGLHNIIKYPKKSIDVTLVSAFVERWYPETNTFHFPFGEMTITLHDVHRILGIPVVGKAFTSSLSRRITYQDYISLMSRGLGVNDVDALAQHKKTNSFSIELPWLAKNFKGCDEEADEETMKITARAYLLYLLGSTIFNDKSGFRVPIYYLDVLMDLDFVGDFNWGAATLCFIYRQLGLASRATVKQLAGFIPLVEIWVYDHFSPLGGIPNRYFIDGEPTLNKWHTHQQGKEDIQAETIAWRERLDSLSAQQVDWCPMNDVYPIEEVTWYSGCIAVGSYIEAYHPERVVRQMGHIQQIPKVPIWPNIRVRDRNGRNYKVEHSLAQVFVNDWENHLLHNKHRGDKAKFPYFTVPEYIDWFHSISHPFVQKPSNRLTNKLPSHVFADDSRRKRAGEVMKYLEGKEVTNKKGMKKMKKFLLQCFRGE